MKSALKESKNSYFSKESINRDLRESGRNLSNHLAPRPQNENVKKLSLYESSQKIPYKISSSSKIQSYKSIYDYQDEDMIREP